MSRYRSTTVHLLGGCNAASDPSHGVCNAKGQVFNPNGNQPTVHQDLYVCDASLIPCSIGINPCLTIATVGEHLSRQLVQDVLRFKNTIQCSQTMEEGFRAQDEAQDLQRSQNGINSHPTMENGRLDANWKSINKDFNMGTHDKVTVKETMKGFIGGMPCTAYLVLKMNSTDQNDCNLKDSTVGEPHPLLKGRVGGYVLLQEVNKGKLYIIDGKVDMCRADSRSPYTQYMHYRLILAASSGSR